MNVWLEHEGWWRLEDIDPELIRGGRIELGFFEPLKLRLPTDPVQIHKSSAYIVVFRRDYKRIRKDRVPVFTSK
jgi:hypothetical protein